MTTLINTDNEEILEDIQIQNILMIIEITGYSFEYIESLPLPRYIELRNYCVRRVIEQRSMAKALGVDIKDI
jgi:hypothetical protein